MYDICFYHKDCYDGFTAAWIASKWNPNAVLVPVGYGDNVEASAIDGKHVLIVDFSFPAETLRDMIRWGAQSVTVLDHHKTSQAALAEFSSNTVILNPVEYLETCITENRTPIRAWFDMERSGAQLTIDAMLLQFGTLPGIAPSDSARLLVDYVADRDLWKWELPFSKQINAWIMSHDFDLREWDAMFGILLWFLPSDHWVVRTGNALLRQHDLMVKRVIDSGILQRMKLGGYWCDVINCSYVFASEVGNVLSHTSEGRSDKPFAATYVDGPDGRRFSLRSVGDFDVSAIAKAYGDKFGTTGGGHKNAAGFLAPHGWQGDNTQDMLATQYSYTVPADQVILNARSQPGMGADLLTCYVQHLLDEVGLKSTHRDRQLTVPFPDTLREKVASLRGTW